MEQWVPFVEGEYIVVRGILASPGGLGVPVEKAMIKIFTNPKGLRSVQGSGMIRPAALVELHESDEAVDLLLDLGDGFRYFMESPVLKSGKVFAPDVQALVQFSPSRPWVPMAEAEFHERVENLEFL